MASRLLDDSAGNMGRKTDKPISFVLVALAVSLSACTRTEPAAVDTASTPASSAESSSTAGRASDGGLVSGVPRSTVTTLLAPENTTDVTTTSGVPEGKTPGSTPKTTTATGSPDEDTGVD
ncbi:MAG: hypothetical protein WBX15_17605 [Thermoanaerobaculia bacterium]